MVAERRPRWQRRQTLNSPSPMDTLKLQLLIEQMGFPGSTAVNNPTTNAGDARVMGSIPGTEKNLEEEPATHSSILAWEIPWTEEPGMLQSMGLQIIGHNLAIEPTEQISMRMT